MDWIDSTKEKPDGRPILCKVGSRIHTAYFEEAEYLIGAYSYYCSSCSSEVAVAFVPEDESRWNVLATHWKYLEEK